MYLESTNFEHGFFSLLVAQIQTICTSIDLAIGKFELSFDPPIVSKAVSNCGERAHDSNGSRSFVADDISLIRTSRVMCSKFFVMSCHVMSCQ